MKKNTSELIRRALDWAVAKAYGMEFTFEEFPLHEMVDWHPTTDWRLGGLLIEREKICTSTDASGTWMAWVYDGLEMVDIEHGPTPLIAAMRCYVASKLGDIIDVPEELTPDSQP